MDKANNVADLRRKLIERIAWLKKESANGGNHEYLQACWREAHYILDMLPPDESAELRVGRIRSRRTATRGCVRAGGPGERE